MPKKIFIGTSGWNYDHWKGRFYPDAMSKKDWFGFYTKEFDTVEINFSFYHWPKEQTMKNWHDRSAASFVFTIKAPRTITHVRRLKDVKEKVDDFYELTKHLGRKKGCHLFQLPPTFEKNDENTRRLLEFLDALDKRKDNAIEFRHQSWFGDATYKMMKKAKVAFCTVSGQGMPDDIVITSDILYLRLHGEDYTADYGEKELERYADAIRKADVEKVYAYFNNDHNAYAIKNAKQLSEMVYR